MIKLLVGMFADRLFDELKNRLAFVNPLLRNVAIGAMLILSSFALWSATFLLVFLIIFLYFSGLRQYVWPAVWTALGGLFLSGSVTSAGVYLMIKPIKVSSKTTS